MCFCILVPFGITETGRLTTFSLFDRGVLPHELTDELEASSTGPWFAFFEKVLETRATTDPEDAPPDMLNGFMVFALILIPCVVGV